MEKPASQAALEAPAATHPASFHHVGYVVRSIAEVGQNFARSLGAEWDGVIIHDPLQEARVTFMRCGGPETPAVELVEPAGENSPLHKAVAKGGGLHHICYEVDSLDVQLPQSRAAGCLVVKDPLPAVAFGGRRIAWVYTRQKLLVEYLER
jgi:methylmalonyl-CoA/ethylmalonyl-CoA epimerase